MPMATLTGKDKIVLHFNRGTQDPGFQFHDHIATHKFSTPAAAKGFIEAVLEECWERVPEPSKAFTSDKRLVINDWIVITADGPHTVREILASKKSEEPPHPYSHYAQQISAYHWGAHPQISERARTAAGKPPLDEKQRTKHTPPSEIRASNERNEQRRKREERESRVSKRTAAPKPPKAPRTGVKRAPEGYLSIEALGFDARAARAALRATGAQKPANGWCWPKSEAEAAKKLIAAAIKKMGK